MNNLKILKRIAILFVIIIFSSCESSTQLVTDPPGANVYINGAYMGKTPMVMADKKLSMSTTYIAFEKEGYVPLETFIVRDEDIDVGAAIGGIFLYYPWLWLFKYDPVHSYTLMPVDGASQNNDFFYGDDNPPNNQNVTNTSTQTNQTSEPVKTKAQKLIELKQLYDDGILTEDEYNTEKQKILDQDDW